MNKTNWNLLNVKKKQMEKRLCQEHTFLNGVHEFPQEEKKLSLTANLNVWQHQNQMKILKGENYGVEWSTSYCQEIAEELNINRRTI